MDLKSATSLCLDSRFLAIIHPQPSTSWLPAIPVPHLKRWTWLPSLRSLCFSHYFPPSDFQDCPIPDFRPILLLHYLPTTFSLMAPPSSCQWCHLGPISKASPLFIFYLLWWPIHSQPFKVCLSMDWAHKSNPLSSTVWWTLLSMRSENSGDGMVPYKLQRRFMGLVSADYCCALQQGCPLGRTSPFEIEMPLPFWVLSDVFLAKENPPPRCGFVGASSHDPAVKVLWKIQH